MIRHVAGIVPAVLDTQRAQFHASGVPVCMRQSPQAMLGDMWRCPYGAECHRWARLETDDCRTSISITTQRRRIASRGVLRTNERATYDDPDGCRTNHQANAVPKLGIPAHNLSVFFQETETQTSRLHCGLDGTIFLVDPTRPAAQLLLVSVERPLACALRSPASA